MPNIYLINDLQVLTEEIQTLLDEINHIVGEDDATEMLVSHIE